MFMMNAKYISSSAVKNQSDVSADIFTARLVFTEKHLLILGILYSG